MTMYMNHTEFESVVADALDRLPEIAFEAHREVLGELAERL